MITLALGLAKPHLGRMPRMPTYPDPDPPDKVFGLTGPADMLRKLAWEIYRFREVLSAPVDNSVGFQTPAYHAFNCAVTAWHLADWIWESATASDRDFILSKLEPKSSASKSKEPFTRFQLALMARYRSLHLCRQLATGAKHKIVVKYADPEVTAKEDWHGEPRRFGDKFGSRYVDYSPRLTITDRDETRPAVEVFEDALRDWDRLLREWGYFEAPFLVGEVPELRGSLSTKGDN